ncbi:hypothetical protein ACFWAR_06985 [Streptomyces sp. NPDC059917]|uniref:hypothetical protein n=1 Tax=Streptomyces sp. NPDC059917 TaxID=3347002 RepID=UPI00364821C3
MRTTIGYILESIGYVVGAQGLIGFGSRTFFDTEWGWLHKVVDLPPAAYLGIVAVGLVLVVVGVRTRRTPRHQETV